MTPTSHDRRILVAMGTGLVLTIVATLVPHLDHGLLADHVRAGYPTYSRSRIDQAVRTYLIYLSIVGAMGAAGWLWMMRVVWNGERWAPVAAIVLAVLGLGVALFNLLIKDTSGDTGLPLVVGLLGALPSVAGVAAVGLMWTRSRSACMSESRR